MQNQWGRNLTRVGVNSLHNPLRARTKTFKTKNVKKIYGCAITEEGRLALLSPGHHQLWKKHGVNPLPKSAPEWNNLSKWLKNYGKRPNRVLEIFLKAMTLRHQHR